MLSDRSYQRGTIGAIALAAALHAACGSSSPSYSDTAAVDGGGASRDGSASLSPGPGLGGGVTPDASQPPGSSAPPAACDLSCAAAGGACASGVCTISENPGGVPTPTQGSLTGGGSADAAFRWLYPYDKTVFPRGLIPPTLQFDGAAPDAVYVHVSESALDYKGFYGASSPARAVFSDAIWTAITKAAKATDTVKVSVTKISSGKVTGPITESWTIAQGNARGTIYYETYGSQIVGDVGILKIQPGAKTPTAVKQGCGNVCHTASADGSTLIAATQLGTSASYDLKNTASTIYANGTDAFTYGGLYPDGTFSMSATNYRTWASSPSRLYDTKTGAGIAANGWDGAITNGGTAAFSPDGTMIAFNHEDTGGGHTLAVMSFTAATKTFSSLMDIANDASRFLGWPAFTPDTKRVVYHAGSSKEFETDNGATGDLYITDLATKTATRLDAADGYSSGGTTYLPANDPDMSFAPTVLPEAVGGYFWAVFTSHRSYGNTAPTQDNGDQNGKLWVTAIDMNPKAGQDPSHPAFFLDGQELTSDNLRGFWVLNPCKGDGRDCASGDECCGGFCRPGDGGTPQCIAAPPSGGGTCSQDFEKCTTAADCCNAQDQCIAGRCAEPAPK